MKDMIWWVTRLVYIYIIFFYIMALLIGFDHDYSVIIREDEMNFTILYVIGFLTIIYYIGMFLYKKYEKISLSHIAIILITFALVRDVYVDGSFYDTITADYYLYFYILLLFIHSIIFLISLLLFYKKRKNSLK